ncbi:Putative nucleotide sugar dehydrogenase [Heliorestis convoluta]|uniref:Nucleotide sugar dehydrogenase n=1 Tax=Heliorestis convoluta TaxID=356322 RepID=A0A5Q2N3X7_9FIRM|nr:Putative nucleotide sugar dehydrogenase [Heliorestis convoluta]
MMAPLHHRTQQRIINQNPRLHILNPLRPMKKIASLHSMHLNPIIPLMRQVRILKTRNHQIHPMPLIQKPLHNPLCMKRPRRILGIIKITNNNNTHQTTTSFSRKITHKGTVLPPDPPRINHNLLLQNLPIHKSKSPMIYQKHHNISSLNRLPHIRKMHTIITSQRSRQRRNMRLHHIKLAHLVRSQMTHNLQSRTLPQIINISLKRKPQQRNHRSAKTLRLLLNLTQHMKRLPIIHIPSRPNQPRLLRRRIHNKPRIHCNTMTTHPRSRLQNTHPRMAIGQINQFPHIHIQTLANQRKLIGKSNIHITKRILRQLRQLRRPSRRQQNLPLHKRLIKKTSPLRRSQINAAHNPVVINQLPQNLPRQHPLRTMRQIHLPRHLQIRPQLPQPLSNRLCRSHRTGRLQNNQISRLYIGRNSTRRRLNIRKIRHMPLLKRRRHRQNKNISLFRIHRSLQIPTMDSRLHQNIQIRLINMDLTTINRLHSLRIHINTMNTKTLRR